MLCGIVYRVGFALHFKTNKKTLHKTHRTNFVQIGYQKPQCSFVVLSSNYVSKLEDIQI